MEIDLSSLADPANTPTASWGNRRAAKKIIADMPPFDDRTSIDQVHMANSLAEALRLDPHNPHGWFNLGLLYKFDRRWRESALCNRRAALIVGPDAQPEFWNLATAATALGDWDEARWAWTQYGIPLESTEGEVKEDFGPAPIRLFNGGNAEVLWAHRICPARVKLVSVPFPTIGHRWGDIVLNDGAPRGTRMAWGREFPVLEELERLVPSSTETLECVVSATEDDINALIETITDAGWGAENWTTSVEMLCKACSEGHVDRDRSDHQHGSFLGEADGSTIAIAAPYDIAVQHLDAWIDEQPNRSSTELRNAESGWKDAGLL